MGKKSLRFPHFLLSKTNANPSLPWPGYCHEPRTISFRSSPEKVSNALNLPKSPEELVEETVVRGVKSDRLFFRPGESNSILEEAKVKGGENPRGDGTEFNSLLKESVVMSMDSKDPFVDFKKSMAEMVEAHGLKDWGSLEELLSCYLKLNGRRNHGFLIAAFVDLLVSLAFSSSDLPSASSSSSSSFSSSSATASTTSTSSSGATIIGCSCPLSPYSPLSFCTSSNFSDDASSTPCVSSVEQPVNDDEDDEVKNS